MKLLENILVFVSAVFKLFQYNLGTVWGKYPQNWKWCCGKGPLPNFLMVWYSLSLSIHPATHLRLPQQNNLRPAHYYESPIAQWLEHPTGIWKVVGLILASGSDFFLSISLLYLIYISSNHSSMCCFRLYFIIFVKRLSVPPGKGC